jgi:hypothetical protein
MLSCAPLVASVILGRESSSGTQYGGLRQTKAPSFKEGLYIQIRTTERHDGNNTLTLGGHVLSGSSSGPLRIPSRYFQGLAMPPVPPKVFEVRSIVRSNPTLSAKSFKINNLQGFGGGYRLLLSTLVFFFEMSDIRFCTARENPDKV